MRQVMMTIAVIFTGSICSHALSQQFINDTLAVRTILDSSGIPEFSTQSVWTFIKAAPWLSNQPADTAGGRIRSLSIGSILVLHSAIGALDSLNQLFLGAKWDGKYNSFSLPPELFTLSALRLFQLVHTQLDSLPAAIGLLKSLEQLVARDVGISRLPAEFGDLRSLQGCDLTENKLSRIPGTIGNLKNLGELYLYSNALDSLPPEIGNLENLGVLLLDRNNLHSIPMQIGRLSKLSRLGLNDNYLATLPDSIVNLPAWLVNIDSNSLCSLPCPVQAFLDRTSGTGVYWRMAQRCPVIPVPACSTLKICPSFAFNARKAETEGPVLLYDLRGRFIRASAKPERTQNQRQQLSCIYVALAQGTWNSGKNSLLLMVK